MLYDLNIPWSPQTSAADLDRTLRFSASLGYEVVALNHIIAGAIPPQVTNPIPLYNPQPPSSSSSTGRRPALPNVLRRATVVLSEQSQHHRLPQLASAYDIVAARPVTEDAFNAACQSLNDVSIISLDLSTRQNFPLRGKTCMVAVDRGVRFEICYAHAFQGPAPPQVLGPTKGSKNNTNGGGGGGGFDAAGSIGVADARARAAFIGNVAMLVRATGGRGIILSSEARSALALRAPPDVVNLCTVWGLKTDQAFQGLGVLPRGVVVNEGMKRSSFRGVVNVVKAAERVEEQADVAMGDAMDVDDTPPSNFSSRKGGNGTGNVNGQKRKSDRDSDNINNHASGDNTTGQPMSKRQAKKMRAAERNQ
ncbi:RNase P subunit p30 [Xylariaceae sp. FL0594]|nr:RNase P subunit p30 [Xylariaceae sp. FL0594]